MMVKEYKPGRRFMARIDHDADLLRYLEEFAAKNKIEMGYFEVIGAVKSGAIGFYEQKTWSYKTVRFDYHLEIGNCIGNFSIRDGKPAVHAHVTFGDESGKAFTGHLMEGTKIFAGEMVAVELLGDRLERVPDDVTKLSLWRF